VPRATGNIIASIERDGFALVPGVLNAGEVETLLAALGPVDGAGRRGMLRVPAVAALAQSERLLALVRPHLPAEPRPVRAIYFSKTPEANWLVAWHQDLTIAVRERVDVPDFGPWSEKDGIPHVQPPVQLLEQMLTVRLHLDHAAETNGALRVLPGSHRLGRLAQQQIEAYRTQQPEHLCSAAAGDALLMRPLILHASRRATSPRPRRILHIEYAGFELPACLSWHEDA